jgi:DNA-binding transcriptional LysR family regulator
MHGIDLSKIDLNLLVLFEALMQEKHVGRAARRLSLSQSAVSHALGRLRTMLDDPLFVRNPRGIEPTPRGRDLAQPISDALSRLRIALAPVPDFDPATLKRTFRIAAHDYALAVLLPVLIAELSQQAPGVDLRCLSIHPENVMDGLDRGELDFALGGLMNIDAGRVRRTRLFSDRFVGVVRRDHPRLRDGRMSLQDLADSPQALISPAGETAVDIDQGLRSLGIERRAALTAPSFLVLPYVIGKADIVGILPERLALPAMQTFPLVIFDLPIEVDPITCDLLMLDALSNQAEMKWLIGLLQDAARGPLESP